MGCDVNVKYAGHDFQHVSHSSSHLVIKVRSVRWAWPRELTGKMIVGTLGAG